MKRALIRGVLVLATVVFLMNILCAQSSILDIYGEYNHFGQGYVMDVTNEESSLDNSTNISEESEPVAIMSSFRAMASAANSIILIWPESGYYYITDTLLLEINTTNPSTCTYSFNAGPEVAMVDEGTEHYQRIYNLADNMASDEPYFVDFYCDDGSGVISDYIYFKINTTYLDKYFIRNNIGVWNYNSSIEIWSGEEEGLVDYYNAVYEKGEEPIYDMIRFWVFSNRTSLDAYVKKYFVDDNDSPIMRTVVIDGKNFYTWSWNDKSTGWVSGNYFIINRVYPYGNITPVDYPSQSDVFNTYLAKYPDDLRIGICGDGKVNVFNLNGQKEECDNNTQSITCGIGIGECKLGQQVKKCNSNCTWQGYGACNATQPKTEVCYDLKDNNCNGVVDENCERFTILSPLKNSVYNTTSVLLNVNAIIYKFSKIEYVDNPTLTSKFVLLCNNCTNYSKKITFKEGNHTLIVHGTLYNGTTIGNTTKFIVDTKDPVISTTKPASSKYTNGADFYIKYSEDNCKSLILNVNGSNIKTISCKSGKSVEESFYANISKYNNKTVSYKFILIDLANNTKESKLTKIKVDTLSPSIKNFNATVSGLYVIFNMTILNEDKYSFDKVEYMDNSTLKPTWKSLCTSLVKGNVCYKKVSLSKGNHSITVRVLDEAGNSDYKNVSLKR
jgi:hypothetical protein